MEPLTKDMQTQIVSILKKYKALKVKEQNMKEQRQAHIFIFENHSSYQETKNDLFVKQMDRVMNDCLDDTERTIIIEKYVKNHGYTDLEVCEKLLIKKDKYYQKKKSAMQQLAVALGISSSIDK